MIENNHLNRKIVMHLSPLRFSSIHLERPKGFTSDTAWRKAGNTILHNIDIEDKKQRTVYTVYLDNQGTEDALMMKESSAGLFDSYGGTPHLTWHAFRKGIAARVKALLEAEKAPALHLELAPDPVSNISILDPNRAALELSA
jgi:hypothetical protein